MGLLNSMAAQGRNGDTRMAHVTPGEVVIPKEVAALRPDLMNHFNDQIRKMGGNPDQLRVGKGRKNPNTGVEEFATQEEITNYLAQYNGNYSPENLAKIANDAMQYGVSTQQLGNATGYTTQEVRDAFGNTPAGYGSPVNSYLHQDFRNNMDAIKAQSADKANYDPSKVTWGNTDPVAITKAAPGFNTNFAGGYTGTTAGTSGRTAALGMIGSNDPIVYSGSPDYVKDPNAGKHFVTNPTTGKQYDITAPGGGTDPQLAAMVNSGYWAALPQANAVGAVINSTQGASGRSGVTGGVREDRNREDRNREDRNREDRNREDRNREDRNREDRNAVSQTPRPVSAFSAGTDTTLGQVNAMLAKDSEYLQNARTKAAQASNDRGLLNSSIGAEAGTKAAIDAAALIGDATANQYQKAKLTTEQLQSSMDAAKLSADTQARIAELNASVSRDNAQLSANTTNTQGSLSSYRAIADSTNQTINNILVSPSLTPEAKQQAIDNALMRHDEYLAFSDAISGYDLSSMISYA